MTKTLTEQWEDETLPDGYYYMSFEETDNKPIIYQCTEFGMKYCRWHNEEVLAPVPSYDEVKRLQEQLKEAQKVIKFYAETTVGHKQKDGTYGMWLCSGEMALENPLHRIKTRMDYICYDPRPAKKWLKKWGVK